MAEGSGGPGEPEFTVFRQNSPNPDDVDWWGFPTVGELGRYLPVFERGGLLPEATSRRPALRVVG